MNKTAAQARATPIRTPARAQKARPVALSELMFPAQAFAAIGRGCLTQLRANAAGALASDDPEFVHQMRVALRRLRSALRLFRPHLDAQFCEVSRADLQWLAALLGTARDWDVLAEDTLPRIFGAHAARLAGPLERSLRDSIAQRRGSGRTGILKALGGRRYKSLLRHWDQHLAALDTAEHGGERLAKFAAAVLRRGDKAIHLAPGALAKMAVPKRHRYRIKAKRLRYAVDFFAPLYPPQPVRRYAAPLARLQDALGTLNDDAVALSLIAMLPVTAGGFGIVQRSLAQSTALALDQAQSAASKLSAAKAFWNGKRR